MNAGDALILLLAAALVVGLAADAATVIKATSVINELGGRIIGMPTWEVRDRIGKPTKVATRSTLQGLEEIWQYGAFGGCYVAFWQDRVVEAACR